MSELLICPKCETHNHYKSESKKERICYWFNCGHQFTFKDRLYALKRASKLSFKKLAFEADINKRTFEGLTSGRFTPDKENMEKIQALFDKYFGKPDKNDFVAE